MLIAVVQIGRIGDMILTTPLFSQLKEIFPESGLLVLASEKNHSVAELHPSVENVMIFEKNLSGIKSFLSLRSSKIDYWIDTKNMYSRTSGLLVNNVKPDTSLGFNFAEKIFSESLSEYTNGEHALDINLSPVNFFHKTHEKFSGKFRPELTIPDNIQTKIRNKLSHISGNKKILLNYSAGNETRYLTPEIWTEALNLINLTDNIKILITGLEKDKNEIEEIIKTVKSVNVELIDSADFTEFAAIIKFTDLIVTPDTSAVHVCSAFNKPVLAFYPDVEWNYNKFRPLSDVNEVLFSDNEMNMAGIKPGNISEKIMKLIPRI